MPTLLAIDSCNERFSCAVVPAIEAESSIIYKEVQENFHATVALPLINDALQTANIDLKKIDIFAFNAGPGKFSALRLICAIARSFAYANKKLLIAVPAFCALAEANFKKNAGEVKCAYPAHKDHVYWGCCQRDEKGWSQKKSPTILASNTCPTPKTKIINACGAGFSQFPHLLGQAKISPIEWTNAQHIAITAIALYHAAQWSNPLNATPLYARKKVAMTILERQQNRAS